jgi:hypothetical protein
VSFAVITLCVASQQMLLVVVYFVIDSVRKLLDTPSYSAIPACGIPFQPSVYYSDLFSQCFASHP